MTLRNIVVALVIGLGIVLLAPSSTGQAYPGRFLVENHGEGRNPCGKGSEGCWPDLWGISTDWEIVGQSRLVCSDWGSSYSSIPPLVRNAITAWEGVLTGVQFYQGCGSGRSALWFKRRSVSGGDWPSDCSGAFGCAYPWWQADGDRRARYLGSVTVWINDTQFSFTDTGLQYVAAHEMGHAFGLDEWYEDWNVCQSSPPPTVMDTGYTWGGCENVNLPTTSGSHNDKADTTLFHQLNPMTQITSSASPGVMLVTFYEPTWADTGYRFYAQRWVGGTWVDTGQTWLHKDYVGLADHYVTTAYIKAPQPPGTYRLRGYSWNARLGIKYERFSPSQYIP